MSMLCRCRSIALDVIVMFGPECLVDALLCQAVVVYALR